MELPSSILIFRLGLGLGIRKFSLLAGINERWLRKIESNQGGMSLKNAMKMKEILENILKEEKDRERECDKQLHKVQKFYRIAS